MKVEISSVPAFEILKHLEAGDVWYSSGILIGEMKDGTIFVSGSHPKTRCFLELSNNILEYHRIHNPNCQIVGRYQISQEIEDEDELTSISGGLEVSYDLINGFKARYEGKEVDVIFKSTILDGYFIERISFQGR